MPRKSGSAKTYCTLREAFDLVGTDVFGTEWQGFEADCDPAQAKQQTDTKSLRYKEAPDRRSFTEERLPDPKRPIDGKDGVTLIQAAERYTKALAELLRLIHSGTLPTEFIPENETTVRRVINASAWPDPAKFDPKNPTWNDLWFSIAADRVVLKSAGESTTSGHGRDYGDLWWVYSGRPGHVEINREALEKALRSPEEGAASGDVLPTPDTAGAETASKRSPVQKPGRRPGRGRKVGTGSFAKQDAPFVEQMRKICEAGTEPSDFAAAGRVVQDAEDREASKMAGSGIFASKQKRLYKRYKERYGDS